MSARLLRRALVLAMVVQLSACVSGAVQHFDLSFDSLPPRKLFECGAPVQSMLSPRTFWVHDQRVRVYPGDETWRITVLDASEWSRPGWRGAAAAERRYLPFEARRGFRVTLSCGARVHALQTHECPLPEPANEIYAGRTGRILHVDATDLGSLGSADEPCQLRVELRDEGQRWEAIVEGVVIRPSLRDTAFDDRPAALRE